MLNDEFLSVEPEKDQNKETLEALQALSADLQEKGVRSALHSGGNLIVRAMKANAPDDKRTLGSHLAMSINKTQVKTGAGVLTGQGGRFVALKSGEVGLVIGPNKKLGGRSTHGTASITEWGARAHTIGTAQTLFRIAKSYFFGPIYHPGVRGTGWMSKSMDAAGSAYEQQFYLGLEKWLDKHGR